MSLSVVSTAEAFDALESGWSTLHEAAGGTLFQGWAANRVWWRLTVPRDPKARLHIVTCRQGEALKLVLPGWLDRKGTLRFLQTGSADCLDVLCADPTSCQGAVQDLAEHLQRCSDVRQIRLTNLPAGSQVVRLFPYFFARKPHFIFQSDSIARIDRHLHDAVRVLRHLGSKRANDLRNLRTRVATRTDLLETATAPFPEAELRDLLGRMEKAGERKAASYATLLPFCAALYELGKVRVARQVADDGAVRSLSALVALCPAEDMVWLDFYDPGVKHVNLKNYVDILDLMRQEGRSLNLGTGAYPYKIRNFAPELNSLYTFHYDRSRTRFVYYFLRKTVARAAGLV